MNKPPHVTCSEEEWKGILLAAVGRVLEQRNPSAQPEEEQEEEKDVTNRVALLAWAQSHMAVGTQQRACFDAACRSARSPIERTTEGVCCFSGLRHDETYTNGKGKEVKARLVTANCIANVNAKGERGRCEEVFTVEYEWLDFVEACHVVGNLKEALEHAVAKFIGPRRAHPLDAEETDALCTDSFLAEARASVLAKCMLICNVLTRNRT